MARCFRSSSFSKHSLRRLASSQGGVVTSGTTVGGTTVVETTVVGTTVVETTVAGIIGWSCCG